MIAVAGMAIATSVPAKALMSSEDVAAARAVSSTNALLSGDVQTLAGGEAGPQGVSREGIAAVSAVAVSGFANARHANTFNNNTSGAIQWPFPFGVPISDYFGPRAAPTAGASTNHLGVDFAPGDGTAIQSIADGVVRQIVPTDSSGLGVHVIIDHRINGALVSSVYGHMRVGSVQVATGQSVKVGDIVGLVGNTGTSTGSHLHFEIRIDGTRPVDPYAWLNANAG